MSEHVLQQTGSQWESPGGVLHSIQQKYYCGGAKVRRTYGVGGGVYSGKLFVLLLGEISRLFPH